MLKLVLNIKARTFHILLSNLFIHKSIDDAVVFVQKHIPQFFSHCDRSHFSLRSSYYYNALLWIQTVQISNLGPASFLPCLF